MSSSTAELLKVLEVRPRIIGARIGTVVALVESTPLVEFPGNPFGAHSARRLSGISLEQLAICYREHRPILLMFEDSDPRLPIIIDAVVGPHSVAESAEAPPASQDLASRAVPSTPTSGTGPGARLARIVGTDGDSVLVDFDGNLAGPRRAGCGVVLRNLKDPVVLLALENDWVIVAQLHDGIPLAPEGGEDADVVLKGARVRIEADVELVLKSGSCLVRLDARGKAFTLADQIVSCARGANKVQGGSVQLN